MKKRKNRGGSNVISMAKVVELKLNDRIRIKLSALNFPGKLGRVHEFLPDQHGQRRLKVRFVFGARVVFVTYSLDQIDPNHRELEWEGNALHKAQCERQEDKSRQCMSGTNLGTLTDVTHWTKLGMPKQA